MFEELAAGNVSECGRRCSDCTRLDQEGRRRSLEPSLASLATSQQVQLGPNWTKKLERK